MRIQVYGDPEGSEKGRGILRILLKWINAAAAHTPQDTYSGLNSLNGDKNMKSTEADLSRIM